MVNEQDMGESKQAGDLRSALAEVVFPLERTPDAQCELCHKVDELRPYGANGESICFDCGMKDEATTQAQIRKRFERLWLGVSLPVKEL